MILVKVHWRKPEINDKISEHVVRYVMNTDDKYTAVRRATEIFMNDFDNSIYSIRTESLTGGVYALETRKEDIRYEMFGKMLINTD